LVYTDIAANILVSTLHPTSIIASHRYTLFVISVLHLIVILISENLFFWNVAVASIIFVTFTVFVAIFLFQSPKPLLQHLLLVGLITATFVFIALRLKDTIKLQRVQNCLGSDVTGSLILCHSWNHFQWLYILENIRIHFLCFF